MPLQRVEHASHAVFEVLLVEPVVEQEATFALRHPRALDELEPIEVRLEGVEIGPQELHPGIREMSLQGRDLVLQELQCRQTVRVEGVPELGLGGAFGIGKLLDEVTPGRDHFFGAGQLIVHPLDDRPDVVPTLDDLRFVPIPYRLPQGRQPAVHLVSL